MGDLHLLDRAPPLALRATQATSTQAAIALLIQDGARVLEVGCGSGDLISLLTRERRAWVSGLESDPANAQTCVRRGLSVIQGDIQSDLERFPSASFDYVVFAHTLLGMRDPLAAIRAAARVGERIVVSLDNAAHWRKRIRLMFNGRVADWNDQRACSIRDFATLSRDLHLTIERATPISGSHPGAPFAKRTGRANWFAEQAVFLLAS